MSRQKQQQQQQKQPQKSPVKIPPQGISRTGWKVIAGGILCLVAGFIMLSLTDPKGRNAASVISPFLIVGGYVIVGIGIIFPDKKQAPQPPAKPL